MNSKVANEKRNIILVIIYAISTWITRIREFILISNKKAFLVDLFFLCFFAFYIIQYMSTNSIMPADDAYIHMRIARHFIHYGVPYFNPGQPVASSSSVVWTCIVSSLFFLFGEQPYILAVSNTISTIAIFMASVYLLSSFYPRLTSIVLGFVITVTGVISTAALLMETPVALFFWLLSLIFYKKGFFFSMGICAGLAFATRYEFALWIVICLLLLCISKKCFEFLIGTSIPVLGLVSYNIYFFGNIIPNTIRAKSIIYQMTLDTVFTGSYFLGGIYIFTLVLFVHIGLAFYFYFKQDQKLLAGTIVFGFGVLSTYILRRIFIFPWYVPIFLFPLLLSYCIGYRIAQRRFRLAMVAPILTTASLALAVTIMEIPSVLFHDARYYRDFASSLRVQRYLQIGQELAKAYPNDVLLTSEIGGLGWAFPGRIIDAAGLASPECLKYHPMRVPEDRSSGTVGAIPPQSVIDLQPDLIVSMETFSEALRRDMASGQIQHYRLLANYPVVDSSLLADKRPVKLWGARWTQVFIRTP